MQIFKILAAYVIILSTVTYGPKQFVVKDLMENRTGRILGFGTRPDPTTFNLDSRQYFAPCPKNSIYCESYAGYPLEQMERALKQHAIPEHFFVDDSPPLEVANRWDEGDLRLCTSFTKTIFPTMGRNKYNKWKIIINNPSREGYVQTVRVEVCREQGKSCSFFGRYGYQSKCKQKYMYRRLVALADSGQPTMDMIKLPSGCECVLKREWGPRPRIGIPES